MKHIYLIDKENTGNRFLYGIENLRNEDKVIVFHYEQAGNINQVVLSALANTKASVEIRKMNTHTKNAMDFQICTYLGYLYGKYQNNAQYHIISNDKGYEAAVEFLKLHIDPNMVIDITPSIGYKKNSEEEQKKLVRAILNIYPNKVVNKVVTGIKSTKDTNSFHTFLQKNLNRDCQQIYTIVKPYYTEIKAAF